MIQLKRLLLTFGSLFSGEGSPESDDNRPEMSVLPASANEKIAYKLKGYFDLATTEIDKAVRAEEWGLVDDAIAHYNNASVILAEAKATRSPAFLSASEVDKVQKHQEKIRTWEEKVLDRLQVLNRRKGLTAPTSNLPSKTISVPLSTRRVASPHPKASIPQKSTSSVNRVTPQSPSTVRSTNGTSGSSRSTQEANGQDPKLVETIESLIVDKSPSIKWDDVAGLDKAKQALLEMVILPIKRRDLFTGLRKPARGLLLFGPPGNGKTMLAKAVASESAATFFSVSASSLTSKWVGEGEKLMRTLFAVAVARQPSVIFIDEIDSIMSAREANENEASRRLKSEFLVQFDGLTSNAGDLVIVIGATNKPQELDDAVLRRLVKRIYIPLPDETVRRILLKHNLKGPAFSLPDHEIERIVQETEGYSGSDLQALCEEAALMPIRELGSRILKVNKDQVRPLRYQDFRDAMEVIRPSLLKSKWEELERWNQQFGSN